jgi:short-subunit dehydrogenase
MELRGSGIEVSLIEPGPIRSEFMANCLKAVEAHIDLENTVHKVEYQRQLKRLRGELSGAKGKLGPEAVYEVLKHALTSPKPKPHYIVTKPAKRGVLLKRLLPSRLFYRIMGSLG